MIDPWTIAAIGITTICVGIGACFLVCALLLVVAGGIAVYKGWESNRSDKR